MRRSLLALAAITLALLGACAIPATPHRQGTPVLAASPQVTAECLAQPGLAWCRATCAKRPTLIWCARP